MGLFGSEKMILALEQFNFFPGETIKGSVSLNLKKPTKARKLEVALVGEQRERYRDRDGHNKTRTHKVYSFEIPLGQEQEYQSGDFSFEIKIPDDILMSGRGQHTRPDGALGAVTDVLGSLGGNRYDPVEWHVRSQLDIPMGLDVKKTQKIVIA